MTIKTSRGAEAVNPAAPVFTGNNHLGRTGQDRDYLVVDEGKSRLTGEAVHMEWNPAVRGYQMTGRPGAGTRRARYTSPVIKCRFPAREFLPSWNILLPHPEQGFAVYMRFYRDGSNRPSPWFLMGEGGQSAHFAGKTEAPGWGKTRIDYMDLKAPVDSFQYRIDFSSPVSAMEAESAPILRRMFVHYSGQGRAARVSNGAENSGQKGIQIKVPYRSQMAVEREELRNHICCPTCLAMMLEHYGFNKQTLEVCGEVYDARHDMYGVWPRVSQVAYQHGLKSWITRFRSHDDVRKYLGSGRPFIASIRVGEGELRGARYPKSAGHIIVVTGYRKSGAYVVNDPFSAGPSGAEIEYLAEDIEKVWLDKGGVAVLLEEEK